MAHQLPPRTHVRHPTARAFRVQPDRPANLETQVGRVPPDCRDNKGVRVSPPIPGHPERPVNPATRDNQVFPETPVRRVNPDKTENANCRSRAREDRRGLPVNQAIGVRTVCQATMAIKVRLE